MNDSNYLNEMFWADYLMFEVSQGNVTEETDVAAMKAEFMAGIRGEARL
jgi:hypothetical protein